VRGGATQAIRIVSPGQDGADQADAGPDAAVQGVADARRRSRTMHPAGSAGRHPAGSAGRHPAGSGGRHPADRRLGAGQLNGQGV
jgi:hypothetical protein